MNVVTLSYTAFRKNTNWSVYSYEQWFKHIAGCNDECPFIEWSTPDKFVDFTKGLDK